MPPRFSLKTDLTLSVNAPSDRSFKYNNSANQSWLDRDKYRMKKWPHPVDRTTNWCAAGSLRPNLRKCSTGQEKKARWRT
jgi:hypothetical protein